MEDKIIEVKEELGEVTLNMLDGSKVKTPSKTIYTIYKSGRKDCTVELQRI